MSNAYKTEISRKQYSLVTVEMRKEDNISVCFETGKFFSRLGSLT